MKLIQICFTSGLLIILLATTAQGQTLFSGDDYNGVGVQAGITSINDRPAQLYAVGLSLNRKADLTLSFLNAEYPVNRDDTYSSTTVLLQLAFFPTLEENGDAFSTEVAGGFGGGGIADAPIISFGLGVSKAVVGELNENNIRPRASFGYSILTNNGDNSDEFPISSISTSAALELIFHFQSDNVSFLVIPYMGFYPDNRETAPGLSASFVF